MNITDQAKTYIKQAMEANGVDTLRFYGIPGCCGMSLGVALEQAEAEDVVELINDVKVAIQSDLVKQMENVTVAVEEHDGELGIVLEGYTESNCC